LRHRQAAFCCDPQHEVQVPLPAAVHVQPMTLPSQEAVQAQVQTPVTMSG
jgi:hypothetical protein